MSALAFVRWSVWSYGSDTGTFAQTIANAFSGFTNGTEGTHFRFHDSPLLAILWPLVVLTRSPFALQIAQVVLIALTAFPVAALVRGYVPEPWPTRCALLAALYPPLLANAFSEFHELAFYPLLAVSLLWAADRARWLWFALAGIAAVLVREDVALDLAIIGLALCAIGLVARRTRERGLLLGEPREPARLAAAGAGLTVFALAWLAVYAAIILPRVGSWAPSHFYDYPFAHGPAQTALAVFVHPVQLIRSVATTGRLTYLLEALVPLALLPLFTRWSLLALPAYTGILLSSDQSVWRMGMHYALLWIPWLLVGASWTIARFVRSGSPVAATRWWGTAVALCAVFLIAFNPMHPLHYLRAEPYQHTQDVIAALRCVPPGAQLETHDEWYAHEALAYPHSRGFTSQTLTARYVLFASDWKSGPFDRLLPKIHAAITSRRYAVACRSGTVEVLRAAQSHARTS